jgi:myxalamid-type polyketide synthase MxaE and MxaD/epothilone polyketide synthase D
MRLFCLPYAGAGATAYRLWSFQGPPGLQVCPVQLPGRENRLAERPFRSASALVPELVEGLRRFLDRPFAIFGHSMGALLAFEMVRELRRLGLPQPVHLFVSSHRAPHLPDRGPDVHLLDHAAFLEQLRLLQGTPEEVLANEELMQIAEPILRADFELCATYAYAAGQPLDLPLSVFGGTEDPQVPEDDLHPWREHTRAAMRLRMFPGHHLYLREARQPLMAAILDDLRGDR